jgi:hypothetical protein
MGNPPAAWFFQEWSVNGRMYAERIDDTSFQSAAKNHAIAKKGMWVKEGWRASVSPLFTKEGIKASGWPIGNLPPVNPDAIRRMLATVRA